MPVSAQTACPALPASFLVFPLSFLLQKTLGVFLVWRSPSDNVEVTADVAFTLLNREDFAESRAFQVQRASFRYFSFLFFSSSRIRETRFELSLFSSSRSDQLSNGDGSFIKIAELLTYRPRFVDANGEFQV